MVRRYVATVYVKKLSKQRQNTHAPVVFRFAVCVSLAVAITTDTTTHVTVEPSKESHILLLHVGYMGLIYSEFNLRFPLLYV